MFYLLKSLFISNIFEVKIPSIYDNTDLLHSFTYIDENGEEIDGIVVGVEIIPGNSNVFKIKFNYPENTFFEVEDEILVTTTDEIFKHNLNNFILYNTWWIPSIPSYSYLNDENIWIKYSPEISKIIDNGIKNKYPSFDVGKRFVKNDLMKTYLSGDRPLPEEILNTYINEDGEIKEEKKHYIKINEDGKIKEGVWNRVIKKRHGNNIHYITFFNEGGGLEGLEDTVEDMNKYVNEKNLEVFTLENLRILWEDINVSNQLKSITGIKEKIFIYEHDVKNNNLFKTDYFYCNQDINILRDNAIDRLSLEKKGESERENIDLHLKSIEREKNEDEIKQRENTINQNIDKIRLLLNDENIDIIHANSLISEVMYDINNDVEIKNEQSQEEIRDMVTNIKSSIDEQDEEFDAELKKNAQQIYFNVQQTSIIREKFISDNLNIIIDLINERLKYDDINSEELIKFIDIINTFLLEKKYKIDKDKINNLIEISKEFNDQEYEQFNINNLNDLPDLKSFIKQQLEEKQSTNLMSEDEAEYWRHVTKLAEKERLDDIAQEEKRLKEIAQEEEKRLKEIAQEEEEKLEKIRQEKEAERLENEGSRMDKFKYKAKKKAKSNIEQVKLKTEQKLNELKYNPKPVVVQRDYKPGSLKYKGSVGGGKKSKRINKKSKRINKSKKSFKRINKKYKKSKKSFKRINKSKRNNKRNNKRKKSIKKNN